MDTSISDMTDGTGGSRPPRLPKSAPKVKLTITSGPGSGQVIELTRCVSIVGTRSGCKIQLKSPEVSAVHCAIVNTGEDVYLRDLMSTNGTFLNDLKAKFEKLDDGDTIRVADWVLRVGITSYSLDTMSDLPHVTLEPGPEVFGVEVNGSGKMIKLDKAVGLVGRRPGCDVTLKDRQVSRAHMLLFTYKGQAVFCDLLSNNGVILEGSPSRFGVLHSGDRMKLGEHKIRMVLPGVGRRPQGKTGSGTAMGTNGPSGTTSPTLIEGTGSGTAVSMNNDNSDQVNLDD